MTRKMADSMNVELEYQMKRSMGDFLLAPGVVPSSVTAVPLTPGGAVPPSGAPGAILPPAQQTEPLPPGDTTAEQPQPQDMSPPPGYLQLPPGTSQ